MAPVRPASADFLRWWCRSQPASLIASQIAFQPASHGSGHVSSSPIEHTNVSCYSYENEPPEAPEGRTHTTFRSPPCHSESAREDRRICVRGRAIPTAAPASDSNPGFSSSLELDANMSFRVRPSRSRILGGAGWSMSHPGTPFHPSQPRIFIPGCSGPNLPRTNLLSLQRCHSKFRAI